MGVGHSDCGLGRAGVSARRLGSWAAGQLTVLVTLPVAGQYQLRRLCCDDLASSLVVHHLIMFWRHTASDLKGNQCIVLKCHTTSRCRTWQEVSLQRGKSNLQEQLNTEQLLASVGSACDPDRLAGAVSRADPADKVMDQRGAGHLGLTMYLYIVRHCPPPHRCYLIPQPSLAATWRPG